MILLPATRVDIVGRFRFGIEVDGVERATTQEAVKAAMILFDLGVGSPLAARSASGSVVMNEPPRRREYKNTA